MAEEIRLTVHGLDCAKVSPSENTVNLKVKRPKRRDKVLVLWCFRSREKEARKLINSQSSFQRSPSADTGSTFSKSSGQSFSLSRSRGRRDDSRNCFSVSSSHQSFPTESVVPALDPDHPVHIETEIPDIQDSIDVVDKMWTVI